MSTVVATFWMTVVGMFLYTFVDMFRRDISGWARAGWIVMVAILPILGVLAYVLAAPELPRRPTDGARETWPPAGGFGRAAGPDETGHITTVEYDALKRQALRY